MPNKFGFPTSASKLIRRRQQSANVIERKAFPILAMNVGEVAQFRVTVKDMQGVRCIRADCITPPENKQILLGTELVLVDGSYVMNHNPNLRLKNLIVDDILEITMDKSYIPWIEVLPRPVRVPDV